YDVKGSPFHFFLVRVQRSETFGQDQVAALESAFKDKYGEHLKRIRYNPEAGDVVEVDFTATSSRAHIDTSSIALGSVVEKTGHHVRVVRPTGRPDEPRFSVVL